MKLRLVLALLPTFGVAALEACWYDVPDVRVPGDAEAGADVFAEASDGAPADAYVDDGGCNPDAPFGTPVAVSGVNTSSNERYPRLSADELTIWFSVGDSTFAQIVTAKRASFGAPFSNAAPVAELTPTNGSDLNFSVSADGLQGFLGSTRLHASTPPDASQLWVTQRADAATPWQAPQWETSTFGAMNGDYDPYALKNGAFFYASQGSSTSKINLSTGTYVNGTWSGGYSSVQNLSSTLYNDLAPVVTPDELRIYFASNRTVDGGTRAGIADIWTSKRNYAGNQSWDPPTIVSELAGFGTDLRPGWVSPNGCRLYVFSNKNGSDDDIYVATRGH